MILISENSKIIKHFLLSKKLLFFLCIYKIYLISAEGYKHAKVDFLIIKTTDEIWVNTKDFKIVMGVKNISDLVLKEIYSICETKSLTKKQVNE